MILIPDGREMLGSIPMGTRGSRYGMTPRSPWGFASVQTEAAFGGSEIGARASPERQQGPLLPGLVAGPCCGPV